MNMQEQKAFVTTLCDNIKENLIKDIEKGKVPEEWDGIELRWWIAERSSNCVISSTGSKSRKRAYNNTVLVNNL